MKLLVDTYTLLWWSMDNPRLSGAARSAIALASSEVWVSAASAWEIATKARIGRLKGLERLLSGFDAFLAADHFKPLAMTHAHALLAGGFAAEHRDPFDRMLAAQALIEDATLVTEDPAFAAFGVRTLW